MTTPAAAISTKPREEASPRQRSPRARVLIVDDEPRLGSSLRLLLADEHDVFYVSRAGDALARIADGERFDVILCDLMMPEMNGIAFHTALGRMAPLLAQRVVFITGGAFTDAANAFLRTAPNLCLEKPFEADRLREVLARVLASHDQKEPYESGQGFFAR